MDASILADGPTEMVRRIVGRRGAPDTMRETQSTRHCPDAPRPSNNRGHNSGLYPVEWDGGKDGAEQKKIVGDSGAPFLSRASEKAQKWRLEVRWSETCHAQTHLLTEVGMQKKGRISIKEIGKFRAKGERQCYRNKRLQNYTR